MKALALASALALAFAGGPAEIRVAVGSPAPDFEGTWFNHPETSLEDLKGRLVFIDVWRTWCGPCTKQVPHLNALQKEYGPKGLVVIGVTDEPKSMVSKDIEQKKMKYPVVSDVGPDFDVQYGIQSFPSAFLIDAEGYVVWSGNPAGFEEAILEDYLKQVQLTPELPAAHADIADALRARSFGKAWSALDKALAKTPDDVALKTAADGLSKAVETRLAEGQDYVAAGRFGEAQRVYAELLEDYAGVPGAEAAKPALDTLKKNPAAKDELAAAEKLDAAVAQFRKGDLEKAAKGFASIAKKYADTASGARAQELAALHPLD